MKTFLRIMTCCVAIVLAAGPAWAGGDNFKAPDVKDSVPWLSIVLTLAFVAGVAAPAFKNAKRTHQG